MNNGGKIAENISPGELYKVLFLGTRAAIREIDNIIGNNSGISKELTHYASLCNSILNVSSSDIEENKYANGRMADFAKHIKTEWESLSPEKRESVAKFISRLESSGFSSGEIKIEEESGVYKIIYFGGDPKNNDAVGYINQILSGCYSSIAEYSQQAREAQNTCSELKKEKSEAVSQISELEGKLSTALAEAEENKQAAIDAGKREEIYKGKVSELVREVRALAERLEEAGRYKVVQKDEAGTTIEVNGKLYVDASVIQNISGTPTHSDGILVEYQELVGKRLRTGIDQVNAYLLGEVDRLSDDVARLNQSLKLSQDEVRQYKTDKEAVLKDNGMLSEEIYSLEQRLSSVQKTNDELSILAAEQRNYIETLEIAGKTVSEKLERTRRELSESNELSYLKNKEIEALKRTINFWINTIVSVYGYAQEINGELNSIRSAYVALQVAHDDIAAQKTKFFEQVSQLSPQIKSAETKVLAIEGEKKDLEQRLEIAEHSNRQLTSQVRQLTTEVGKKDDELGKMAVKYAKSEEQRRVDHQKLLSLAGRVDKIEGEVGLIE